ncbi:hypothetical protein [Bacillus alkalicellulosilyticus]|nr:hypothetical protein [Bacillus alkalicellulosilyticus]
MKKNGQQEFVNKSRLDQVEKTFLRWTCMRRVEEEVEKYSKER